MTYGEDRDFLAKHTKLIELTNLDGARVAIAPDYQGRVMTSSCDGTEGLSFGFINRNFISAGKNDVHFNNYGGEERLWIAPEGGQFSLWFKPGVKEQNLDDWFTPPDLNRGAWTVLSKLHDPDVCMSARMKLENASGTQFNVEVDRKIHLLGIKECKEKFGKNAAGLIDRRGVKWAAYETANKIINRGEPMNKESGLISIWMLGMLNAGSSTVVIAPYKSDAQAMLDKVVESGYFGTVPGERLKILPQAILFRADGGFRSKIGTSQLRARDILGSIDFQAGVLTIVKFSLPNQPEEHLYLNNLWGGPHAQPYKGDVMNSYNDGPSQPGAKGMGSFYELESLSPAQELATGKSLSHNNITLHIKADPNTLSELSQEILGIDLETVEKEMP